MSGFAGARARLADALVDAVLAGGDQLAALRAHFSALDPATSLRSLVVNAVDPALLAAVLGPRLSPPWVRPLRAHYLRFKRQYPGDWKDVEAAWRAQRARWHAAATAAASSTASGPRPLSRDHPARDPRGVPGRAAPPRSRRAGRPAPPGPVPGPRPRPVAVPVPFGRAHGVGSGEVAVPAPPEADVAVLDPVEAVALEELEREVRETADAEARALPAPPPPLCDAPAPAAGAARAAAAARKPKVPAAAAAASAGGEPPPLLLERMLDAMCTSYQAVEQVRSFFLQADGAVYGWHSWRMPAHVSERLRQRRRERAVSAVR